MIYRVLFFSVAVFGLTACQPTADEQAAPMMQRIDSLYEHHEDAQTLNAIRELRAKFPEAVKSRRRALKIWQQASLRMAQEDIGRTDSALRATTEALGRSSSLGERNRLRVRRDSLQIRFDALCGTVRVIQHRQQEK
jgi:hypothetical protein